MPTERGISQLIVFYHIALHRVELETVGRCEVPGPDAASRNCVQSRRGPHVPRQAEVADANVQLIIGLV